MRLILAAMVALFAASAAQAGPSQAGVDEAVVVGGVIVASALCHEFALHNAADELVEARTAAGEADYRHRVADEVERLFPILADTRGTEEFSRYCQTMRNIAVRLGLGG